MMAVMMMMVMTRPHIYCACVQVPAEFSVFSLLSLGVTPYSCYYKKKKKKYRMKSNFSLDSLADGEI